MSFGSKKTATSADTTYAPETNYTDSSVNAGGDGSVALGQGANMETTLTMIDVSPEVARAAIEGNRDVSEAAIRGNVDVSGMALVTNRDVSTRAIDTTGAVAGRAIDAAIDLYSIGSRERTDQMNENARLLASNQGLVGQFAQLTGAALERSQTPDSAVTKQLLWVVGGSIVAVALLLRRK